MVNGCDRVQGFPALPGCISATSGCKRNGNLVPVYHCPRNRQDAAVVTYGQAGLSPAGVPWHTEPVLLLPGPVQGLRPVACAGGPGVELHLGDNADAAVSTNPEAQDHPFRLRRYRHLLFRRPGDLFQRRAVPGRGIKQRGYPAGPGQHDYLGVLLVAQDKRPYRSRIRPVRQFPVQHSVHRGRLLVLV